MKVGDYVRTRNGLIFKIIGGNEDNWDLDILYSTLEFFEDTWLDLYKYNDNGGWFISEHCKTSPNIIDLLEVGDYVNGTKVTMIAGTRYDDKDLHCYCDYCENKETGKWLMIPAKDIKSIVTKEQFSFMEYKVGELNER